MIYKYSLFFLFFFNMVDLKSQSEKVELDSSGIITIKAIKGQYLDNIFWTCTINSEEEIYNLTKKSKPDQKEISFFFPYDFGQKEIFIKNYSVIIKKEAKTIFNQKTHFDSKNKGNYKLGNYLGKLNQREIKGDILDVYFFDTEINKHLILRSISKNKRIYFYHLKDEKIINIHTDIIDFSNLNKIKKPIIVTDLNKDKKPEITFKYTTLTHNKIVLFSEKNKFICRKEKEKITYSESLNYQKNKLIKQHLLSEILK